MPETSIQDLVEDVELLGIETVKVRAERLLGAVQEPSDIEPSYELNTAFRDDGAGFRIILRTAIDLPIGQIECDVAAEYELQKISVRRIPPEVFDQFVNDVAIMHILPYTRQGISDVTLRVFANPLTMPIMQRGSVRFDVAAGVAHALATANDRGIEGDDSDSGL